MINLWKNIDYQKNEILKGILPENYRIGGDCNGIFSPE